MDVQKSVVEMLKCAAQTGQEQNWPSYACPWKAAAPSFPSLGAKPAPGAAGWRGQLCYCQCFVTLLLSNSCFMWQMTHQIYGCCVQSLCLKKTAMSKYDVFLCLYNPFNLGVCKVYEGETNHSSLQHNPPHWSCGSAWYGEAELSYSLPGFPLSQYFLSFFKHAGGGFCHKIGQILTRLPSKVVSSPSLEILRTWLDMTLSNLLCLGPLWEVNWNTWPPEVPFYFQLSQFYSFMTVQVGSTVKPPK